MRKNFHVTLIRINFYHVLIALAIILAVYLIGKDKGTSEIGRPKQFITLPAQNIIPEEDTIHIVIPVDD